jgi:hypothetical protein
MGRIAVIEERGQGGDALDGGAKKLAGGVIGPANKAAFLQEQRRPARFFQDKVGLSSHQQEQYPSFLFISIKIESGAESRGQRELNRQERKKRDHFHHYFFIFFLPLFTFSSLY